MYTTTNQTISKESNLRVPLFELIIPLIVNWFNVSHKTHIFYNFQQNKQTIEPEPFQLYSTSWELVVCITFTVLINNKIMFKWIPFKHSNIVAHLEVLFMPAKWKLNNFHETHLISLIIFMCLIRQSVYTWQTKLYHVCTKRQGLCFLFYNHLMFTSFVYNLFFYLY